MTDPRLLLDLFEPSQPVDLIGASEEVPQLPWLNQPQAPAMPNLSHRIQEVLGAKEPDNGGFASDILSSRFGGGGSYGDYAQGVVNSAMGKPQIGDPGGQNEIMKTLAFINTLSSQQANSDFRNQQLAETMRHNRASEELLGQRLTASANKPIPATALKMQNEGLDIIGIAGGLNADLDAIIGQLGQGKLTLGPVDNQISTFQNWAGLSTEGSRNYDSFVRSLEKMRNDSLRLNKGVQTEGDAVRAWNEILANINDEQLVKERLGEVKILNARAADLQKLNIDNIRANYGHDPLDYTQYEQRPASVGAGGAPGKLIGTSGGKGVYQLPDGSHVMEQ